MKEQLIHILDQSVCLSRKQMKEYLSGTMLPEETHAAEVHLSSCPLCSLAMEGFEEHSEQALHAIAALNSGFLKEHFDNISPQIHLNSMAPAASITMAHAGKKRGSVQPLWRVGSIAAAMLLLFGLIWAFEHNRNKEASPEQRLAISNTSSGRGVNGNSGANDGTNSENNSSNAVGNSVNSASIPASQNTDKAALLDAAPTAGKNITTSTSATGAGGAATTTVNGAATARQEALIASSKTATSVVSTPETVPSASSSGTTIKEPPPTKTFVEYDPAVNGADERKDAASEAATKTVSSVASRSVLPIVAKPEADTKIEMERANESYSKGSYEVALVQQKKLMNSSDSHTRNEATIKAALCYAALGNKAKAEELLQRVIENGSGSDRRAARKALRRIR